MNDEPCTCWQIENRWPDPSFPDHVVDVARAKAKHAEGCECGGYFYADGRCPETGWAVSS